MEIVFLGTACMAPTKERNLTGILINYKNENILIDCGEGTQRQMRLANISPTKITKILITHLHGDHIFGLPGLFQTLASSNYSKILEIFGPRGIKDYVNSIIKKYLYKSKILINIKEISPGIFYRSKDFILKASMLNHSIPCLGYSLIENDKRKINLNYMKKFGLTRHPLLGNLQKGKDIIFKGKKIKVENATFLKKGKKITIILDTEFTNNAISLSKNSDILVSEATFSDELKDKAKETKHLTAKQAAQIAKKADVKRLLLTHFSQRYKDTKKLEQEAKKIFKNTQITKDLQIISF